MLFVKQQASNQKMINNTSKELVTEFRNINSFCICPKNEITFFFRIT